VVGGKYRLVRLLGEGGMGAVYEARHDMIGRRFAVKFLHAALAGHAEILARFRREAQSAGSLENENIAAVTDFGSADDGAPYIVMEYLDGEDLARILARTGPLSPTRAAHILIQVCRGLVAAHGRGIVHRDLKPENLLVQQRGDGGDLVKILDFGIAKLRATENQADSGTRTGVTLGTPYYMSPEQARGQKELDERADIYALGVILFELLSGQKPYSGDNYNAILYAILMQPAPRIETLRADLPPGLADLVHRAMAPEANDRFSSAAELAQALSPFVGRTLTPAVTGTGATAFALPQPQPSYPSGGVSPTGGGTRAPVSLTPSPPALTTPQPSSNGGFFVALGAGVLVLGGVVAVAGWFFFLRAPVPPPAAAASLPTVAAAPAPAAAPPEPVIAKLEAPAPAAPAPSASIAEAPSTPPAVVASRPAKPAKPAAKPAPLPPSPTPAKPPAPRPAPAAKDDDLFAP
jgi:serine/threonine-protein kinase